MSDGPYAGFSRNELILRDHLALDRTRLANERTFLAYVRTALAILAGGASALKFYDSLIVNAVGWAFIALAGGTVVVGIRQYAVIRRRIAGARRDVTSWNPA